MLPTLVIVFREVLEASLIVSIVMAATRGVAGRGRWVAVGIGAGIVGAVIVAGFAESIAAAAAGMGQELFNAMVLFAAVGMLGWHNIWMSRHGREIARSMSELGGTIAEGARPLYTIAIVIALAVLREGSEVVLFLYGIAAAGEPGQTMAMLTGGLSGLAAGVIVGAALYFGLLRISTRHIYTVTTWMILFLAAGLASQGASYLVQADLLPSLSPEVWDTSNILSESSLVGQALHALMGYVSQPSGIQLVFYVATLAVIGSLTQIVSKRPAPSAAE